MALIEWRDEFRIGVAAVDHEHEELIGEINRLLGSIEDLQATDAAAQALGEIFRQISAHFALEERMMREQNYDQLAEHKADHERLLDEIRDIMDAVEDGRYGEQADRFAADLNAWFATHFKTMDARLHHRLR
jgi:hemerythrin-like metal-binding protein